MKRMNQSKNIKFDYFDIMGFVERPQEVKAFLKKIDFYRNLESVDNLKIKYCILYALLALLNDLKSMELSEVSEYYNDIDLLLHKVKSIVLEERKIRLNNGEALKICAEIITNYVDGKIIKGAEENVTDLSDSPLFDRSNNRGKAYHEYRKKYSDNNKRINPDVNVSALRQILRAFSYKQNDKLHSMFGIL